MQAVTKYLALIAVLAFMALPAFAADMEVAPVPDKVSLVAFWEESMKKDPHVQKFEKTKVSDTYDFATDFFPYRGRLRLLNAVVSKPTESYLEGVYTGIIEVELLDAPKDFFTKYATSYGAWTQGNFFYYNLKKGTWFPASDWATYSADLYKSNTATSSGCPLSSWWARYAEVLIPLGILVVFFAFVLRLARRQNKRVWDSHERVLEGQRRALDMAEENLKLQREHTQLLKEIAASLKR